MRVSSASPHEAFQQALPRVGGPLLCLLLAACGPEEHKILAALKNCEPSPEAIDYVWRGDRRAPCGERWLYENSPHTPAPSSPLGRARATMRLLRDEDSVAPSRSLTLRPLGLPDDIFTVFLEILSEQKSPDGFEDPWLRGRLAALRDDRPAAARWVGALAWHPDEDQRRRYLDEISRTFDVDLGCVDRECMWAYSDQLAGEQGAPGSRDALSDAEWLQQTGSPRLTGLAGAWIADWKAWPAAMQVVRPGVGAEPAAAIWVGGMDGANDALRAELSSKVVVGEPTSALVPVSPGGIAAASVPW